jgi:hypothetical protein
MKIRSQTNLSLLSFCLIACVTAAILVVTVQRMKALQAKETMAERLLLESHELSELSNDYILFHEKRQEVEWETKYHSLAALLAQLPADRPEERVLIDSITANHQHLKEALRTG